MSIYSLETLSKEGFARIAVEVLVLFGLVTLFFLWVAGPLLQSAAPEVYARGGLDYSRTDPPDTALEHTHLVVSVLVVGSFLYWRLLFTEVGRAFVEAVHEEHEPDS